MTTLKQAVSDSIPSMIAVAGYLARHMKFDILLRTAWNEDGSPDSGDMMVRRPGGDWSRLEIKGHPGVPFDTLNGYPWILVDRCDIFDKKEKAPDFYYIVGAELEQALTLDMRKEPKMTVQKIKCIRTKKLVECYGVARDLCGEVQL